MVKMGLKWQIPHNSPYAIDDGGGEITNKIWMGTHIQGSGRAQLTPLNESIHLKKNLQAQPSTNPLLQDYTNWVMAEVTNEQS